MTPRRANCCWRPTKRTCSLPPGFRSARRTTSSAGASARRRVVRRSPSKTRRLEDSKTLSTARTFSAARPRPEWKPRPAPHWRPCKLKLPKGFVASGVRAGIRKKRPDLGLIVAPDGANAAAVFTQNRFQAAPVLLSKASLKKSGGRMKAVVVNAGCANAVTGKEGLDAARRVRARASELLGCTDDEVLLASTGVIGVVLPDKKVRDFLPDVVNRLSTGGIEALSHAILTTDVGPKVAQATFTLGGKRGRMVGVAKGAGMIHPNMATMLAFLTTDAAIGAAALQRALKSAVDLSFNAISVDGDTSTNDTVLLLASGKL